MSIFVVLNIPFVLGEAEVNLANNKYSVKEGTQFAVDIYKTGIATNEISVAVEVSEIFCLHSFSTPKQKNL